MITIKTLETISMDELLRVFNLSFSDYVVPFSLTAEQLKDKIIGDRIKLELSVGAFEDGQLIAFCLHSFDQTNNQNIAYNAGTGVIPNKRGNNLTVRLHDYALPIFQQNNIHKVLLEVISTNDPAIKNYKKIGFNTIRHLNCYKGLIEPFQNNNSYECRPLEVYDWEKLCSFWDINPTWQNSISAVELLKSTNISIGIYENEQLVGYAIFNPNAKKIHQLAVDKEHRRSGVGRALLNYLASEAEKAISFINVDINSSEALSFMDGMGMELFIQQYEMELLLN